MVAWKRNLWTITAAETVALLGFMVVIPFVPFYVQELGVTDPDEVKLWSSWLSPGPDLGMAGLLVIWAFFMPGLKGRRSPPTPEAGSSIPVVPRDAGIDRPEIEGGCEEDG